MEQAKRQLFENDQWLWEKHYPKGLSWRIPLLKKPLFHILDRAAAQYPHNDLCIFQGRAFTYEKIAQMADRVAAGLQKIGVKKGVKVGLFLPNMPYSVAFYFGILKAGGTVVNYNPLYVDRELSNQIGDSGTDIMVTTDLKFLTDKMEKMLATTQLKKVIVCPMADVLPFPKNILYPLVKMKDISHVTYDERHISFKALADNDGKYEPVHVDADDIAVLQYTGGTTGVPKGAMLTHGNVYANVQQTLGWVGSIMTPGEEVMMGVLPLFHVFGMTVVMHCSLWMGMKIVLLPKFSAEEMIKAIRDNKATFVPAVPSIFNAIAVNPTLRKTDFDSVKFCMSGGAPLPGDVQRLFTEKTGCTHIGEGYGLSETSPVACFNPPVGKIKPGTVGLPIPGTVVEILSLEDSATPMPVGEKGEVCISGPQVMKGYYNKPEETAAVLKRGRLHTGDVGFIDDEGYLHLVDRIKDMIIVRGYKVYPRFVEEALYKHPGVEECIVAGVADAERGETVRAWIKPAAGYVLTEDELKAFLHDKVSPIEIPRQIVIRTTPLPKTAVGKLSKKDLLAQEGLSR